MTSDNDKRAGANRDGNRSLKELELLHTISTAVSSTLKLDRLFKIVLGQVVDHLGYDRGLIMLLDRKRKVLYGGKVRGASAKIRRALRNLEIPIDLQYEVFERVIGQKKPYIANPAHIEKAVGLERELLDFLKTRAVVVLPLVVKKKLVGILWVDYARQARAIFPSDVRLLEQVASQVGIAVAHAQAYTTITELNANLEAKVNARTRDLERTGHKLKEAFKTLKDLDDFKNKFFTNISHELRTPLTLLLAPLDLLVDRGGLSTQAQRIVGTVKDNAKQLLKMINALLDLSKISAGKVQLRFQLVDLGRHLQEIATRVTALAEAKGIRLTIETTENCHVYVDPDQIIIVVQNLLANALKFTKPGGEVYLKLRDMRHGDNIVGDTVCIEVRDTGKGIPNGALPHIFERFNAVKGDGVNLDEGTGIGLALARELVELHGGTLRARSVVGAGTVMQIELKRGRGHLRQEWIIEKKGDAAERPKNFLTMDSLLDREVAEKGLLSLDSPLERQDNAALLMGAETGWTILVVEDHPEMLAFLRSFLSERYRVLSAPNGEQGLQIARAERPDLVLTDISMDGMNGLELCRSLKKDLTTRNIPIVLLTARTDPDEVVRALESHGADDYVTKPFHVRELLARVERLLRVRDMQSQLLHAEKLAAIGQLSAGLAHEINNPLGFIKSGLSSLRKKLMELERKAQASGEVGVAQIDVLKELDWVFDGMDEGIDRIRKLVRSLKDYSRNDSQTAHSVDLKQEVELVLQILGQKAREKNVKIDCQFGNLPAVYANGSQLGQVLMNLVHNAIQAVPDDQGRVLISAESNGAEVIVRVKDNGPGIGTENIKRIFHPFFTTKEPGGGLGLGLSICDQIVRSHGGTLRVESRVGEGACFTFNLPQRKSLRPTPSLPASASA